MSDPGIPLFVATAYRWGWTNAHQYLVYVGLDREKAIALANEIPEERGGKYGCQVIEISPQGAPGDPIHYVPSMHREHEPFHNYRKDMFETLGHTFHSFSNGSVMLPDPTRPGTLKPVAVEPPQWVIEEVAHRERQAAAFDAAMVLQQAPSGPAMPAAAGAELIPPVQEGIESESRQTADPAAKA